MPGERSRLRRSTAETVWWWTGIALLVAYVARFLDEQPGYAHVAKLHLALSFVVVWPVVIVAGLIAGFADRAGSRWAWVPWVAAGLLLLPALGALAFGAGGSACTPTYPGDCEADAATRLAVVSSAMLAWAFGALVARSARRDTGDRRRVPAPAPEEPPSAQATS